MATYYNYISVRDQLISASQEKKCEWKLGLPKNVKDLKIDIKWTAKCSDPCTPGFCEVHIFIFLPSTPIPQTINLYYTKKNTVAYVFFNSAILSILNKDGIIEKSMLHLEKNASKVLPDTLP